jgi:hypothetical protein
VGFVTLIVLFVTVLILLLGGGRDGREAREQDSGQAPVYAGDGAGGSETGIFTTEEEAASRMKVPDEYKVLFEPEWKPFRPVHDSWSRRQIDQFWIEPERIVEQQLKKESEEAVRSFLEELP